MTSKPLPSLIAVIDVGTHKTASLLGQIIDGKARMLSFSERRTDGVVKGTVTDLEKLTQCVHEVVNDIERGSGRAVEQIYLSLSGPAAEGERVKGFVAVPAHDGKVTAKDVTEAIQSAKRLEPPAGRTTILYMRQPTMLDNRPVSNPVGMAGKRLEVNFWRVTMEEGNMRMRVGMVNGLSIRVRDFILASHAAACATAGSPPAALPRAPMDAVLAQQATRPALPLGEAMARLDGDSAEIQRFAVDSLFSAVSAVIGLVGAVALMLMLSWQLSLLLALLVPIEVLWLRWMRRKVEREVRNLRERSADVSSFLVETLPAMKFIQAAGQQGREAGRLDQLGQGYMRQLLKVQVTEFFTQAIPGTLTSWCRACAFLVGGWWVIQGTWQLGALIAFSTYMGMAVGPVQSLLGLYVAVQRMAVSLGRVMELKQEAVAVHQTANPQPIPVGPGELRLEALSFAHEGRQGAVLKNVQVSIPGGLKVAISGASGVGKSTLIDLLQRIKLAGEQLSEQISVRFFSYTSNATSIKEQP